MDKPPVGASGLPPLTQPDQTNDLNDKAGPADSHSPVKPVQQQRTLSDLQEGGQRKPISDYKVEQVSPAEDLGRLPSMEKPWQVMSQCSSGYLFTHRLQPGSLSQSWGQIVYQPRCFPQPASFNALWQNQLNDIISHQNEVLYGLLVTIEQQKQLLITCAMNVGLTPSLQVLQQLMPAAFYPQALLIPSLVDMRMPLPAAQPVNMTQQTVTTGWTLPGAMGMPTMVSNQSMELVARGFYAVPEPPKPNLWVINPLYEQWAEQMTVWQEALAGNNEVDFEAFYRQAMESTVIPPSARKTGSKQPQPKADNEKHTSLVEEASGVHPALIERVDGELEKTDCQSQSIKGRREPAKEGVIDASILGSKDKASGKEVEQAEKLNNTAPKIGKGRTRIQDELDQPANRVNPGEVIDKESRQKVLEELQGQASVCLQQLAAKANLFTRELQSLKEVIEILESENERCVGLHQENLKLKGELSSEESLPESGLKACAALLKDLDDQLQTSKQVYQEEASREQALQLLRDEMTERHRQANKDDKEVLLKIVKDLENSIAEITIPLVPDIKTVSGVFEKVYTDLKEKQAQNKEKALAAKLYAEKVRAKEENKELLKKINDQVERVSKQRASLALQTDRCDVCIHQLNQHYVALNKKIKEIAGLLKGGGSELFSERLSALSLLTDKIQAEIEGVQKLKIQAEKDKTVLSNVLKQSQVLDQSAELTHQALKDRLQNLQSVSVSERALILPDEDAFGVTQIEHELELLKSELLEVAEIEDRKRRESIQHEQQILEGLQRQSETCLQALKEELNHFEKKLESFKEVVDSQEKEFTACGKQHTDMVKLTARIRELSGDVELEEAGISECDSLYKDMQSRVHQLKVEYQREASKSQQLLSEYQQLCERYQQVGKGDKQVLSEVVQKLKHVLANVQLPSVPVVEKHLGFFRKVHQSLTAKLGQVENDALHKKNERIEQEKKHLLDEGRDVLTSLEEKTAVNNKKLQDIEAASDKLKQQIAICHSLQTKNKKILTFLQDKGEHRWTQRVAQFDAAITELREKNLDISGSAQKARLHQGQLVKCKQQLEAAIKKGGSEDLEKITQEAQVLCSEPEIKSHTLPDDISVELRALNNELEERRYCLGLLGEIDKEKKRVQGEKDQWVLRISQYDECVKHYEALNNTLVDLYRQLGGVWESPFSCNEYEIREFVGLLGNVQKQAQQLDGVFKDGKTKLSSVVHALKQLDRVNELPKQQLQARLQYIKAITVLDGLPDEAAINAFHQAINITRQKLNDITLRKKVPRADKKASSPQGYKLRSTKANDYISRGGQLVKVDFQSKKLEKVIGEAVDTIRAETGIIPGQVLDKKKREDLYKVWLKKIVPNVEDKDKKNYGALRAALLGNGAGLATVIVDSGAVCRELSVLGSVLFAEYGIYSTVVTGDVKANPPNKPGAHAWIQVYDNGDKAEIVDNNFLRDVCDNFDSYSSRARGATVLKETQIAIPA